MSLQVQPIAQQRQILSSGEVAPVGNRGTGCGRPCLHSQCHIHRQQRRSLGIGGTKLTAV
nr:hypothetical protein [Stenomitos frigidus]